MKYAGILILSLGVAVSAAYGARLSPTMRAQMVARGRAQLLASTADAAHGAYCASFAEGPRPPIATLDGCAPPAAEGAESGEAASAVDVEAVCAGRNAPEQTEAELARAGHAALEPHYDRDPSVLSADQQRLRTAWLAAAEDAVDPGAAAAVLTTVRPQQRLTEWLDDSGVMFFVGILLVIAGAVLGRMAVKREASAGAEDGAAEARDLGELLAELRDEVATLAAEAAAKDDPAQADFDALKTKVHDLQLERFEPVIDSAPRVQAKYGMGPFAEIFGPLSSAERYVNRAWSALVDHHWPEGCASLQRAAADLKDAEAALSAHSSSPTPNDQPAAEDPS